MAIVRSHCLVLRLRLRRRLFSASAAPPPISASAAKSRLRREFDPEKVASILSSSSPATARHAVYLAVRLLGRSRRFSEIESIIESHKASPEASSEPFLASLILSYGGAGMLDHASRTFDDVPRLTSAPPTALSLAAILTATLRSKQPRRVPDLFADLSRKHSIVPDAACYGILVKALCVSGNSNKAFDVLNEMREKGIEPNTVIYTTILDSLYKEGKAAEAEKLWKEMTAPDLASYNVRVTYHALRGSPEEVLRIIAEMKSTGLKPDTVTLNFLLTAYCKNGRFEDAKELYKGFKEKGYDHNAATFKNYLYFLSQNGDLDLGLEVFNESVKKNKVPDFRTTSLFVEELVKALRVDEAKAVIGEVKKKFPENLLGGWKKVEKKLGLHVDDEIPDSVEAA